MGEFGSLVEKEEESGISEEDDVDAEFELLLSDAEFISVIDGFSSSTMLK
jgi:hypothetical protein